MLLSYFQSISSKIVTLMSSTSYRQFRKASCNLNMSVKIFLIYNEMEVTYDVKNVTYMLDYRNYPILRKFKTTIMDVRHCCI